MPDWLSAHEALVPWMLGFSLALFVIGMITVPLIVVGLPETYFARTQRTPLPWWRRHRLVQVPLLIVKNLVALALIVLGITMLVLPGQGLLTILIGVLLLDFPGKYRLERWLIGRPRVLALLNRVRRAAGRAPFVLDSAPSAPADD